jgi:transposase
MYYSGIDLHKRSCCISTIDSEGILVDQVELPNDECLILNYFQSKGGEHRAVVECTANWYWLSDLLLAHGIDLTLAHAKYLKAICYAKVKTDKVDSLTLAQLLRMGLVPAAHQIDPEMRWIRDVMRSRLKLMSKKISSVNSIHRILEKFNISVPEGKGLSYPAHLDYLEQVDLDKGYRLQVNNLCAQIRLLDRQIKGIEKWLKPILVPNVDVRRLLTLPGVGEISGYTIYLEVDGIDRFESVKRFLSYCRLVPGADNSSGRRRHKSGNKDGNRYLKVAFTDAVVKAAQHYPEIGQFYRKKLRKKLKPVARTIVAQELAKIAYHVLKYQTVFETFKGIKLSKEKKYRWPRPASPNFLTGSE